jgi:hypothetical protein
MQDFTGRISREENTSEKIVGKYASRAESVAISSYVTLWAMFSKNVVSTYFRVSSYIAMSMAVSEKFAVYTFCRTVQIKESCVR